METERHHHSWDRDKGETLSPSLLIPLGVGGMRQPWAEELLGASALKRLHVLGCRY